VLLPGESRWECAARRINVRKEGQTDGRTPDRCITFPTRSGERKKQM